MLQLMMQSSGAVGGRISSNLNSPSFNCPWTYTVGFE